RRLSVAELLPMLQAGDEANEFCADCGTRQPEWCSLNLGCLLCIECSGIHRSLGTHISKVRSLTLDVTSFTPVTIAMMLATGNPLNALVFEPPPDWCGHPGPDSSRQVRQLYIEAKYVERRFVDREWRPAAETGGLFESMVAERSVFVILAEPQKARGGAAGAFWTAEVATALLFAAIEAGDMLGVMRALALGASINSGRLRISSSDDGSSAQCASPLLAALFGMEQLARLFCPPGAEPLEGGFRVHLEIAELLILNGAFINIADDAHGFTPLHVACLADNAGVVKYLTDKGADPLVASSDGRLALAMLLPPGEGIPSAARAIIAGATLRAEERVRLDAAKSPVHGTTHFGVSSRMPDTRGPVPRRGSGGSGVTGRAAFESRHSGSGDGMGDRPVFENSRSENSVFSAARRFTQSLVPSPAIGSAGSRMSVSTERPSLMEIGGHHVAEGAQGGGGGWLASLAAAGSMNKRGRRLTSGFRDLGSRFGGAVPPGAVAIAGARGADTGCGADVPPMPTILSAREEEDDLLSAADDDSDDEGSSDLDTAAASRSAPNVAAAIAPCADAKVPVPPIPEEDTPVAHASVRSTRSNMALNMSRGSGKQRNISPIYQVFGSGAKSAATSPIRPRHRRSESSGSESNSFVEVIDTPTVRASKHINALGASVIHRRDPAGLRVSNSAEAFGTPMRHEMPPPLPDNPLLGTGKGGVGAQASGGNKLMLRLLPRSSRMAFTGIFGRGDKKSTVHADPHPG
ncbi:hypothetical protein FBU31_003149, partial [Coemansia sp. 'formosensis']